MRPHVDVIPANVSLGKKINTLVLGARSVPLALLVLCILAYGLLIPDLGFYWDDWPWMWLAHLRGDAGLLEIDRAFRPLAGVILWLGNQFAGQSPLGWQIVNLSARWLTGVALFWMLRQLWPGRLHRQVWISLLFLVFPAFTQQFIAVNSLRHILPLAFYFLSIGLMLSGVSAEKQRKTWLSAASLGTMLISMLSTEYYYGLELLRPVFLWIIIGRESIRPSLRLKQTLWRWAPFLAGLLMLSLWRYWLSQSVNYPVTFSEQITGNPTGSLLLAVKTLLGNFWETSILAWSKLFDFPQAAVFGPKKTLLFWGLVTSCFGLTTIYLFLLKNKDVQHRIWAEAIPLGTLGLLVAGLPFLATGLEVGLNFPSNRLTLPMAFGSSLLLVGLMDLIPRMQVVKILLVSLTVALAVGVQYKSAASYQQDWDYQEAFLRQFTWRVPGLEPDTTLLTVELPNSYSTDNSLTAPLNWIYHSRLSDGKLPYLMLYLDLRLGSSLPSLASGQLIHARYGDFDFSGSTDRALVALYDPPGCLRLLHPQYDSNYPQLNELLKEALPLSNLDLIQAAPKSAAQLPEELFGPDPHESWCYYFQKADLARQIGDWQQVAKIGEAAFQLDDSPNHASERVPFIQGYAHTGDWERAHQLTLEALKINKFMRPMLCNIWSDITTNTPGSPEKDAAGQAVQAKLNCPNWP